MLLFLAPSATHLIMLGVDCVSNRHWSRKGVMGHVRDHGHSTPHAGHQFQPHGSGMSNSPNLVQKEVADHVRHAYIICLACL